MENLVLSRKRHRRFLRTAAAIATVASVAAADLLHAQEEESPYAREPTQGVYVRDSAVALEKFPLVARLERMNEWAKAADVLQEILENYPDRVIQTATNDQKEPIRYTSVANAVQQQIARWPAEGLAAYRARFEPIAEARYATIDTGDIGALRQIYWQYFNTAPGLRAGIQLVDLYFRDGDFRAARDIAQRLLSLHPLLSNERPALLYRAALLAHLLGDESTATELLNTLRTNHPQATGTIAGEVVNLADSLQQQLQIAPATAQSGSPDHWPMFGGDLSRGRVSTARGGLGARLFRIPLSAPDYSALPAEQRAVIETQQRDIDSNGNRLGVIPVVDDGVLFFQDGRRIYAVSLESGQPLPAWQQTHPGGAYIFDTVPVPVGQQLTVTVTEDAVLAVMGFSDLPNDTRGVTRIVCLDRATGRERWIARPSDLPDRDALRTLNFSGSPLVVGDSVHIIGRGGKGAQFEDCYLVTLDLRTGAHRWSTYLASASTDQVNIFAGRQARPRSSDTTSHIAYAGGKLYVLTNVGAVAAVDAYSGIIDWLSIYQRNVPTTTGRTRRFGARARIELPRPWTFNPAIIAEGHLFVLPTDGNDLLIFNAETGEQVKAIRGVHLDNPTTIVGVLGDRLVVCSDDRMKCINWRRYEPEQYADTNIDIVYWPQRFPGSPIRGRPFMTTESVFVPTRKQLKQIDLRTGRVVANHPAAADTNTEWEEGPGNILVTADRVVVATASSVDVYTDLTLARAKLDAEVAASPDNPDIRLRYAEVMFVAGREDVALAKLDEAVSLLGGLEAMRSGPARHRLFYTALRYAEQMATRRDEFSANLANQLYDRAAAAAETPSQQVQYRLSRAQFADAQGDRLRVAELYQQILDDPQLRLVTISDPRFGGATQAAAAAEQEIASLIRRAGRGAYAKFDELARQGVAAAGNDPQALLELAARYPNADVIPSALLAAADAFEAAGQHRPATRTLRLISHKYPDAVPKVRVLEAMARNYLAMPNRIEVAISRLSQGVRIAGNPMLQQPLVLPDGTTIQGVSFTDAANALREHAARVHHRPAPDFHLPTRDWTLAHRGKSPFPDETRKRIDGIDALVPPAAGFARHDRIVTWSADRGVAIYPVGATQPLGQAKIGSQPPQQAAWIDDGLLLWTPTQLVLVDRDSAMVKWTLELQSLPAVGLVEAESPATADDRPAPPVLLDDRAVNVVNNRVQAVRPALPRPQSGSEERFIQAAVTLDRVMLITSTGRLVAADLADGSIAWQSRLLDGTPIDRVIANDDFTVVRLIRDDRVDLVVFDTYSGELISRRSFSTTSGTVPLNFALAADGTLVYVLPDRVCAKDLYDPGEQLNWEVPGQAPGRRVYDGAVLPDHLLIQDGRVIVLSDEGQFVRMHSLQTGRLIRYPIGEGGREVEALLATGTQGWDTRLMVDGTYLYVMSPRTMLAYNLENPQQTWQGFNDPAASRNYRDAMIGSDYIVLLDAPGARDGDGPPSPLYNLFAFSRTRTHNGESGLLVLSPTIRERSGIRTWQGVEGGLYYLAGDRTLHFLGGIRP